ncbi:helix-turn-helix domain-containing protein [Kitasatospora sp. NPDC059577]|uniref:helix-turn-helix domain-containing protein n=1 Tax=Kitasatospora sp. NPDC059577 TaxID=3346873 RepID=UPI0036A04364
MPQRLHGGAEWIATLGCRYRRRREPQETHIEGELGVCQAASAVIVHMTPVCGFSARLPDCSSSLPWGWCLMQPTLDEIRSWAATVDVPQAALALGISRSHPYGLIKRGSVPFRVVQFGNRYRVITASLVAYLEAC